MQAPRHMRVAQSPRACWPYGALTRRRPTPTVPRRLAMRVPWGPPGKLATTPARAHIPAAPTASFVRPNEPEAPPPELSPCRRPLCGMGLGVGSSSPVSPPWTLSWSHGRVGKRRRVWLGLGWCLGWWLGRDTLCWVAALVAWARYGAWLGMFWVTGGNDERWFRRRLYGHSRSGAHPPHRSARCSTAKARTGPTGWVAPHHPSMERSFGRRERRT